MRFANREEGGLRVGLRPSRRSHDRSNTARLAAIVSLGFALLLMGEVATAEEPAPGVDDAVVHDAEVAARRAEAAAAEARAIADLLATERGVSGTASENAPVTRAELEEAVARAEQAAEQAAAAARAVSDARRVEQKSTRRAGFYAGGAFFYGAENFDDSVIVKSSTGGSGFVGYRFGRLLAAEARYEGFEGFDLKSRTARGVIDGYALTLSFKAYPFEGAIQPFVGMGAGMVRFRQKNVHADGSRARADESDGTFRFAGGVDLWLTDHVVLNLEAAYLAPLDDLSNLDVTILSTGLTLRY